MVTGISDLDIRLIQGTRPARRNTRNFSPDGCPGVGRSVPTACCSVDLSHTPPTVISQNHNFAPLTDRPTHPAAVMMSRLGPARSGRASPDRPVYSVRQGQPPVSQPEIVSDSRARSRLRLVGVRKPQPGAWDASSMTGMPCRPAMALISSISAGSPPSSPWQKSCKSEKSERKIGDCHQFAPRHDPRNKALTLKRIGWLYPIFPAGEITGFYEEASGVNHGFVRDK